MKVSARRRHGYAHELTAGRHKLLIDEPEDKGGTDSGPAPSQLLALSLAGCTAVTIEMYAEVKGWDVGDLEVEVDYELKPKEGLAHFEVLVKVPAALSDEQLERIKLIAHKCPVHRALQGEVAISDTVERVAP
jgi:putative redox protein